MLHQRFSRFSQLGGPGRHTSEFSAERSGPAIGPFWPERNIPGFGLFRGYRPAGIRINFLNSISFLDMIQNSEA